MTLMFQTVLYVDVCFLEINHGVLRAHVDACTDAVKFIIMTFGRRSSIYIISHIKKVNK